MSAAKMVADSTQEDLAAEHQVKPKKKKSTERKTKKTKVKKGVKKVDKKKTAVDEDALLKDPDLDLTVVVKDIGDYIRDREEMLNQMLHAVKGPSLHRALPDILKEIPADELKQRCLEHLEVMSKKRIRRILAGNDPATISSSGTEDESTDEETKEPELQVADSTSQAGEQVEARTSSQNAGGTDEQTFISKDEVVMEDDESDDGVWRTPPLEGEEVVEVIEEVLQDEDEDGQGDDEYEEVVEYEYVEMTASEGEEGHDEEVMEEGKEIEDEEGKTPTSAAVSSKGSDDRGKVVGQNVTESGPKIETEGSLYPMLTQNQMELLELEMRARAIKAMLKKHQANPK